MFKLCFNADGETINDDTWLLFARFNLSVGDWWQCTFFVPLILLNDKLIAGDEEHNLRGKMSAFDCPKDSNEEVGKWFLHKTSETFFSSLFRSKFFPPQHHITCIVDYKCLRVNELNRFMCHCQKCYIFAYSTQLNLSDFSLEREKLNLKFTLRRKSKFHSPGHWHRVNMKKRLILANVT